MFLIVLQFSKKVSKKQESFYFTKGLQLEERHFWGDFWSSREGETLFSEHESVLLVALVMPAAPNNTAAISCRSYIRFGFPCSMSALTPNDKARKQEGIEALLTQTRFHATQKERHFKYQGVDFPGRDKHPTES